MRRADEPMAPSPNKIASAWREALTAVVEDYHRDFRHNHNAKQPAETSWRACQAPRCHHFRDLIDGLPGTLVAQSGEYVSALKVLHERTGNALREMEALDA